ncbi:N2,N2-dimethylguanosine tRNA methyltransferase [Exophiala oligosperma]|uniref:tRNA (guanine(26)-N(2))-dimethyltransferase n=1 Tax=Exophiala oligosperma TaxID=215243 RepID=A0A0D2B8L2_9EURO|nr:N2,N2-dimethylguanosine tRNA methyltransferase [Exophiala oligosperma]KIW48511.1 N2,N2-dimethylguanosine tRNA methyltransferase [Exophiala oligosperma]
MASSKSPEVTEIDGKKYRKVTEGLASVLAPYKEDSDALTKTGRNNDEGAQAVFYNPIQQFNRDLSVLAISVYAEGAVLEKEARQSQKHQGRKNAKERKKQHDSKSHGATSEQNSNGVAEVTNTVTHQPVTEQNGSRKRKADDITDPDAETAAGESKKARTNQHVEDDEEDDDLPVEELTSNVVGEKSQQEGSGTLPISEKQKYEAKSDDATNAVTTATQKRVPFAILDALSATGLRALRYAKEIPLATNIVANDLSPASVQNIELNIKHNEVQDKVNSNLGDAREFMYSKVGNEKPRSGGQRYVHRFDVIDLDPYGTAAPFIDASLQAVQDGGMLCVTCTDAGVFASTGYPEKTYAMYGGMPVKGPYSHEGGLRLILNAVAVSASRYGLAVEPLLSLYIDYYARLFIRVHRRPQEVKLLPGTTMTVYNCGHGCGAWTTQPLLRNQPQTSKNGDRWYKFSFAQAPTASPNCEHCGSKTHLCGPMWAGPLHNPYFVQKMLDKLPSLDKKVYGTTERLEGMLTVALEEDLTLQRQQPRSAEETTPTGGAASTTTATESASADGISVEASSDKMIPRLPPQLVDPAPFFILPTNIAKVIHCATPSESMVRGAIISTGYRVTRSHCKPGSIKTDAPWSVLWEIMREFMRQKAPIRDGAVKRGTPGWSLLAKVRGGERALVSNLAALSRDQLSRCESREDMKTVLHGMLKRLEIEELAHDGKANGTDTGATTAAAAAESTESTVTEEKVSARQRQERSNKTPPPPSVEPSKLKIVFDEKLGRDKPRGKLVRYQMNPRENWGPMNRAGRTG